MIEFLRAIVGGLFLFLIPGMAWYLLLFGKEKKDILEMVNLSIALSISLSTLSVFFLNLLLGVEITLINAGIILFILTIIPVFIWMRQANNFSELYGKISSIFYKKSKNKNKVQGINNKKKSRKETN